eukprot:scaffold50_cov420-Prasinococcus_capsulatus_cf.AAC.26
MALKDVGSLEGYRCSAGGEAPKHRRRVRQDHLCALQQRALPALVLPGLGSQLCRHDVPRFPLLGSPSAAQTDLACRQCWTWYGQAPTGPVQFHRPCTALAGAWHSCRLASASRRAPRLSACGASVWRCGQGAPPGKRSGDVHGAGQGPLGARPCQGPYGTSTGEPPERPTSSSQHKSLFRSTPARRRPSCTHREPHAVHLRDQRTLVPRTHSATAARAFRPPSTPPAYVPPP